MNKIEKIIYDAVKHNTKVKRLIKIIYQSIVLLITKVPEKPTLNHIVVAEGFFFGFHDKSPWSNDNKYVLAHAVNDIVKKLPAPDDELTVGFFYDHELKTFKSIGKTKSWNWQQGSMLQWIGQDNNIIYNFWDGHANKAKIVSVDGKVKKILPFAVGAVSPDGKYVVGYDFERLNIGMPGYGYANYSEKFKSLLRTIPDDSGYTIYNIEKDKKVCFKSILEINRELGARKLNKGYLFVTHFLFSPGNHRFLFLLRSFNKGRMLVSRMISCNYEGKETYIFPCGDMVSHITWIGEDKVLAYCSDLNDKDGYYLFHDQKSYFERIGDNSYTYDGHPQYCKRNNSIITDSYPNRRRLQELSSYDLTRNIKTIIGRFYSPIKFIDEYRCDLHPRWDRRGEKVCIDTTFTGKRSLGIINLKN